MSGAMLHGLGDCTPATHCGCLATAKTLTITVYGTPGAQGSKRHVGHGIMIESNKRVKPWRQDVKTAAENTLPHDWTPFTGPVAVDILFWFARPKSHYRTGRNAHLLRDDAPTYATSHACGDLEKLVRATNDALTAAGIWTDDALVAELHTTKVYADHGQRPGATISIEALS